MIDKDSENLSKVAINMTLKMRLSYRTVVSLAGGRYRNRLRDLPLKPSIFRTEIDFVILVVEFEYQGCGLSSSVRLQGYR